MPVHKLVGGGPPPATHDLIDSRIGIHDSNHFEVKLDYSIDPKLDQTRYRVETYFFVPRSLGINSYTYSREQFYSDIQAYIRFKTPQASLGSLCEEDNRLSPLARLAKMVPKVLKDPRREDYLNQISYDLRLVGCLIRANLRDRVTTQCERLEAANGDPARRAAVVDDVRASGRRLIAELEAVVTRFRELRPALLDPVLPAWLRETHQYVDEYLSLASETHLTRLVEQIDHHAELRPALEEVRQKARDRLLAEREHRRGSGYPSVLDGGGSREHFVYRQGLLKKFVMSVLFLEISKEKEGRRIADLGAAIAAGLAMLVATVAGVFAQQRYGLNTWPFVVALVVSYMLKDRLKDWLKLYFSAKMTRFLADYDVRIHDPLHGVNIGRCREAFSFIGKEKVPSEVLSFRHRDSKTMIETSGKPEVVMKYEKEITLLGSSIANLDDLHHDINDIIRFDISQFLVRTDDPVAAVPAYQVETDRVELVECPKVYHINVVFVLRAQTGEAGRVTMERIRVILDKRGIRKLEQA
ncbi:MAG: hypothetical protein IT371_10810 [Deltaproteobacteria bacterium]|nr:hypothetical protein [Deltaproteobacteria bacterium]